jgi:hypothetical protein
VPLSSVSPATGDIFAEVRQRIEGVTLSYSDVRNLSRYYVRIPAPSRVGEPFQAEVADEERIAI